MSIQVNDRIHIKGNLKAVLDRLGFLPETAQAMGKRWGGTNAVAHAIWTDEDSGTTYVTVDLCCEIPLECCEPV